LRKRTICEPIVSERRRINNFCIRNRFSLMKTTCLNRFSRFFILSVKLAKINWFNMCIKISGNNFITYMRKKTNLVIFKAGKNFRSKIRSCWRRINNFCIRNRFSLMKTTCLNRFSRYFHNNHWKHARRHPMAWGQIVL
jgi:hypothetical protein